MRQCATGVKIFVLIAVVPFMELICVTTLLWSSHQVYYAWDRSVANRSAVSQKHHAKHTLEPALVLRYDYFLSSFARVMKVLAMIQSAVPLNKHALPIKVAVLVIESQMTLFAKASLAHLTIAVKIV